MSPLLVKTESGLLCNVKMGPKKGKFLNQLVTEFNITLEWFFAMQNQRIVWKINIGLEELSFLVKVRKMPII